MAIAGATASADFTKICPLVSRRTNSHDYGATEIYKVQVRYVTFGDDRPVIIAGPCSVESYEQTLELAQAVKACGGDMLRGGAFKPRTSPHDFQGLGLEGLQILHEVGRQTGLPIVTEVMDPRLVEEVGEYADMLQIGSRNMQNYPLLVEVGRFSKPVLLKRGMAASLCEWLGAAEYIAKEGNFSIVLCERGIKAYPSGEYSRFILDLNVLPAIRQETFLPVIADPSHATGVASMVEPASRAAIESGAQGLLIEIASERKDAQKPQCDGAQAISPTVLNRIAEFVRAREAHSIGATLMRDLRNYALPLVLLLAVPAFSQTPEASSSEVQQQPATTRYANMPDEAVPYRKFAKPYKEWYLNEDTLAYNGAARDRSSEKFSDSPTVRIGFLGPLENNPEAPYGRAMLQGAELALNEANARGGFKGAGVAAGKPYELKIHDDAAQWGAASAKVVKMALDENVVAVLGSIDGASTHIMLRVSLKLEFPIVDTGTTDPTVTETRIPWLIHNFPDDRQQGYALADYTLKQRKLKRIGVIRTQSRYARVGVQKFFDEAKRLGRVPVLEVKFMRGDQDFSEQIRMLQNAHIDGVVIWGEAAEGALILKQMRTLGMKQPVFGASRLDDPSLPEIAGSAAEGLITTSAVDLSRPDAKWQEFQAKYREAYHADPDAYAAYAYDGMNMLVGAIESAGLNRGKIMDALRLYQQKSYAGVAEQEKFDHTLNNISPVSLARVQNGKFIYWTPQKDKPLDGQVKGAL